MPRLARPADASAAISVRGLTRRFDALTAVDGLSLEVAPGELFGLVGPDGAGKTTTLRMLAGVLRPTEGDALLDGVSVVRDPEAVKHHIAYMSQRFGLYTDLTVRENIDFYADLYEVPAAERAARLERLYHFSNLGPFEHRLAGQLSGGMKQKLGLSCALIHQPRILLLDEPTFGVDPISRRDLWLILSEMVTQGVTVLVSTAYMDEAERCDQVALLDRGRVIALDTPSALQASMAGQVIAVRTAEPRRALELLRDAPWVKRTTLFGDTIHVIVEEDGRSLDAITSMLGDANVEIAELHEIEASLEDVFIDRVSAGDAGGARVAASGSGV
ncbi:MAG: ABC transporter ATP-binding protein [Gemmatimonadaceae bacterium]